MKICVGLKAHVPNSRACMPHLPVDMYISRSEIHGKMVLNIRWQIFKSIEVFSDARNM
jgi:hypothetical protein